MQANIQYITWLQISFTAKIMKQYQSLDSPERRKLRLERTVRSDWASPTAPEVTVLSNLKDGLGQPIGGLGDGELQWHSDQSYMLRPATGAALYALELPPEGGETFWVDLRAAFGRMPRQLRAQIAGK